MPHLGCAGSALSYALSSLVHLFPYSCVQRAAKLTLSHFVLSSTQYQAAPAAGTYPGMDLQGLLAVALHPLIACQVGLGHHLVEFVAIDLTARRSLGTIFAAGHGGCSYVIEFIAVTSTPSR